MCVCVTSATKSTRQVRDSTVNESSAHIESGSSAHIENGSSAHITNESSTHRETESSAHIERSSAHIDAGNKGGVH